MKPDSDPEPDRLLLAGGTLPNRAYRLVIYASFVAPGIGSGSDLPMLRLDSAGVCPVGDTTTTLGGPPAGRGTTG